MRRNPKARRRSSHARRSANKLEPHCVHFAQAVAIGRAESSLFAKAGSRGAADHSRSRGGGGGGGGGGGRAAHQREAWGGGSGGRRHGASRATTLGNAELDAVRHAGAGETYRFYHGTSWEAAERILREGFQPSTEGCLGPGIYVARREKAERFARDENQRHGEVMGGLVEVLVTVSNPKFVEINAGWNDGSWQATGHDACRAESTTASTNMEWCIKNESQVQVVRTVPVRCAAVDAEEEERVLEKHAAALEVEIREREQKVATLREWAGSAKRKRDEERAEKERLAAEAREQERLDRKEAGQRRAQRLQDRGRHFHVSISDSEAHSLFMSRCDTPDKFQTVNNCAVFDGGGFFIGRDNGRSFWSRLPSALSLRLINEGKNTQGDLQYAAGGPTGAYYAELDNGETWCDHDRDGDDSRKQEHYRDGAKVHWREDLYCSGEWKRGVISDVNQYYDTYDVSDGSACGGDGETCVEPTRLCPRFEAGDTVDYRPSTPPNRLQLQCMRYTCER